MIWNNKSHKIQSSEYQKDLQKLQSLTTTVDAMGKVWLQYLKDPKVDKSIQDAFKKDYLMKRKQVEDLRVLIQNRLQK